MDRAELTAEAREWLAEMEVCLTADHREPLNRYSLSLSRWTRNAAYERGTMSLSEIIALLTGVELQADLELLVNGCDWTQGGDRNLFVRQRRVVERRLLAFLIASSGDKRRECEE